MPPQSLWRFLLMKPVVIPDSGVQSIAESWRVRDLYEKCKGWGGAGGRGTR